MRRSLWCIHLKQDALKFEIGFQLQVFFTVVAVTVDGGSGGDSHVMIALLLTSRSSASGRDGRITRIKW